jgi:dephospho-CoA kinase
MLIVGLTGGIASGKSVITRGWKKEQGVLTIDADQIVHELYRPGTEVHRQLIKTFGTQIVSSTGEIDRRVLGQLVFQNESVRQQLNSIVHPAVQARLREMAEEARAIDVEILVVEAALLLESDPVDRSFFH